MPFLLLFGFLVLVLCSPKGSMGRALAVPLVLLILILDGLFILKAIGG